MGKHIRITFDEDVPQSQRFELEQKLSSAGWIVGAMPESHCMPPITTYAYIVADWVSHAEPRMPDLPPGCHIN